MKVASGYHVVRLFTACLLEILRLLSGNRRTWGVPVIRSLMESLRNLSAELQISSISRNNWDLKHNGVERDYKEKCIRHDQYLHPHHMPSHEESKPTWLIGNEITNSIGHSAMCIGDLLKLRALGIDTSHNVLYYSRVANSHLLKMYLSKHLPNIEVDSYSYEAKFRTDLHRFRQVSYFKCENGEVRTLSDNHIFVEKQWVEKFGESQGLLTITPSDLIFAEKLLAELGLSGFDFLLLHVRNDTSQSIRNSGLEKYKLLIEYAAQLGLKTVFLGDGRVDPDLTVFQNPYFIDYSHFSGRTAQSDIILFSLCSYFVGTTSGPKILASLFGKPILWTNAVGYSHYLKIQHCIFMPKLFRKDGQIISFPRMNEDPQIYFNETHLSTGVVQTQENSEQELVEGFQDLIVMTRSAGVLKRVEISESLSYSALAPTFNQKYPEWEWPF